MYNKIMDDGTFTHQVTIGYSDVDYTLHLKPQRILELCQDIAVLHSDVAGYSLEFFRANHSGWGLTEWHIKFNKLPLEGEKIDFITWTKRHKRVQADRSFKGIDKNGNEIFRGLSRWFLLDTQKRKPKRFDADFFNSYGPSEIPSAFENEDFKHPPLNLYEKVSTKEHLVTRRDIDANNHTNNIAYIIWALDDLPNEVYLDMNIRDLKTEYKREALVDENLTMELLKRTDENGLLEYSTIFTKESGEYLCRVTTKWESINY